MNNEQNTPSSTSKIISKPRIISGITFIVLSVVLTLSFVSYLMNWKSDQSQAGTMADKTVQSSNIFGKIGDWLGNLFIFESIGVAAFVVAFLFFVFGTLIFKKIISNPGKLFLTVCFSFAGHRFSLVQ
jgi:S-DNA-T family DNA segregation ATPase FtsK/SpoIIIE